MSLDIHKAMACASEPAQSPELLALVKNISLLSDGITNISTVTHFALLLEEGGFITSDKSSSVRQTLGISDYDKCVSLLDAVKEQVKISPAKFNAFIDLLNREPALQIYADKLTDSHGEHYIHCSPFFSQFLHACYHSVEAQKCTSASPGLTTTRSEVGFTSCHDFYLAQLTELPCYSLVGKSIT